jgi:ABC-type oligopeptide transport system substrate-binding subunit
MIAPDGKPVAFEIMLKGKENQQVAVAYQQTLAKLGIDVTIRSVDAAQFLNGRSTTTSTRCSSTTRASLSPGVEQVAAGGRHGATSRARSTMPASPDPADRRLIDALLNARERDEFVDAVRAYRSRAVERCLCRSALFQAGAMDRALEADRASAAIAAARRSCRHGGTRRIEETDG